MTNTHPISLPISLSLSLSLSLFFLFPLVYHRATLITPYLATVDSSIKKESTPSSLAAMVYGMVAPSKEMLGASASTSSLDSLVEGNNLVIV